MPSRGILLFKPDSVNDTLPHELCHVLTGKEVCPKGIPSWAGEGYAISFESPAKRLWRLNFAIKEHHANKDILFSEILTGEFSKKNDQLKKDQPLIWYGLSYSLVGFFVEKFGSDEKFIKLVNDIRNFEEFSEKDKKLIPTDKLKIIEKEPYSKKSRQLIQELYIEKVLLPRYLNKTTSFSDIEKEWRQWEIEEVKKLKRKIN